MCRTRPVYEPEENISVASPSRCDVLKGAEPDENMFTPSPSVVALEADGAEPEENISTPSPSVARDDATGADPEENISTASGRSLSHSVPMELIPKKTDPSQTLSSWTERSLRKTNRSSHRQRDQKHVALSPTRTFQRDLQEIRMSGFQHQNGRRWRKLYEVQSLGSSKIFKVFNCLLGCTPKESSQRKIQLKID